MSLSHGLGGLRSVATQRDPLADMTRVVVASWRSGICRVAGRQGCRQDEGRHGVNGSVATRARGGIKGADRTRVVTAKLPNALVPPRPAPNRGRTSSSAHFFLGRSSSSHSPLASYSGLSPLFVRLFIFSRALPRVVPRWRGDAGAADRPAAGCRRSGDLADHGRAGGGRRLG